MDPWTPGINRTVPLRARNRVLGLNLLLGTGRKMLKLSCLPWGNQFHMCQNSVITLPASPEGWEPEAPGAEPCTPECGFSGPSSEGPGGAVTLAPGRHVGCPGSEFPGFTLRMMNDQHCNDVKPVCSEVTGSDVLSHRTVTSCLRSCALLTLGNH